VSPLRFPVPRQPDVSVVIVTYGAAEIVARALRALVDNTESRYELIVIDNASPDETPRLLRRLENAKVVFNSRNHGFGPASNQGAALARGRHLLFLNSDVLVQPGWLPPLLERIQSDPGIGAVGPMLLDADGSLQLAGALLSRSGSTAAYGDGDDPDCPEYRFARVVDYLSGACLLVRRAAFNEVGGFDAAYRLAYFEDADLCLALAERGYRTCYEPRSRVVHLHGGSGGSLSLRQHALANRAIFERRWRAVLASRPFSPLPASRRRIAAARDAPAAERILVLDDEPAASGTTAIQRVRELAQTARVTVAVTGSGPPALEERLLAAGIEIATSGDWSRWLGARRFHYDVVAVGQNTRPELDLVLRATQPQAVRVHSEEVLSGPAGGGRKRSAASLADATTAARSGGGLR
jgi:GT2 family glycosyltransferase